ncbi:MAG: alpha/beta hydrolase [Deltaproteobacteria bacterium]|nr:alpha/beta hydrolase [Deltaproteobacteria bacterium]
MFIRDQGAGNAVLLLHGAPSPASAYDELVGRLGSGYRTLVPELPGYGRSPKLAEPYSWHRLRDDLVSDLRRLGVESAFVVGSSGGGHHALGLAVRSDFTAHAVLTIGSFAAFDEANRALLRSFVEMLRANPDLDSYDLRDLMKRRMLSDEYVRLNPSKAEAAADWLKLTTADVLANELEQAAAADLRSELWRLAMPVVALVGEYDIACPVSCSEEIARLSPRGTLEVVSKCGHSLLVEAPALVGDRVLSLVATKRRM